MPDENIMTHNPQLEKGGYFLRDDVLAVIEICLVNYYKAEPAFCHHCGAKLYFKNMLIVDDSLYCDNCVD